MTKAKKASFEGTVIEGAKSKKPKAPEASSATAQKTTEKHTREPDEAETDSELDYDAVCEQMRAENEVLLDEFEADLKASGLKDATIGNHLGNVEFFINTFLLYYDPMEPAEGIAELDAYFGDWFIRKAMWSTPATIKSTAASVKKFYKSMLDHGRIDQEDFDEVKTTIKQNLPEWQRACAQYNDIGSENPFDLFGDSGSPYSSNRIAGAGTGDFIGLLSSLLGGTFDPASTMPLDELPTEDEAIRELLLGLMYLTGDTGAEKGNLPGSSPAIVWHPSDVDILPALKKDGLVTYDDPSQEVRLTDAGADLAEAALELMGYGHLV